ncbi:MazG nucleotide pyrophosphohydrolase domain-containing protein [Pseudogracilibacillus auburnensis]|uniref:MazG-like nucleotide pyrophosphohydrolase family protein n=1 Tax=Pseudogracilibacillus auburnensis TaxID=1494959 RepID=A0A2V3W335_9BACI|nr:MazG nucleotide pyrophosphohydrolase domain-containing protein [Pseudogracilibacillus auburnensis]MBO1002167.1 pyrophosphatase [Pseudogracilibacillus auburnensis]PXW87491.1 MazG-like nucleotide pyrophosphohydrolase family protein [Pseudogracilibacillus auburnensis]
MNIKELQQYVSRFCDEKGFEGIPLETRVMYLISEIGELTDDLLEIKGATTEKQEVIKRNIGHEMFDVTWNIFDLANKLDIDLEAAFKEKMNINENREWKT